MGFGKVTLLKVSPVELAQRFEPVTDATAPLEGDWSAVRSKGGALFFIGALSDAAIVVPFAMFDSADELALHLRELLGEELDRHVDERGLFVLDAIAVPAAGSYEEAVGLSGSWVPRVSADDPRLNKAAKAIRASHPWTIRSQPPQSVSRQISTPAMIVVACERTSARRSRASSRTP
jgi:hypothetical protein